MDKHDVKQNKQTNTIKHNKHTNNNKQCTTTHNSTQKQYQQTKHTHVHKHTT